MSSDSIISDDADGLNGAGETAPVHGNELTWIPQSSIHVGSTQVLYKARNRFRGHGMASINVLT